MNQLTLLNYKKNILKVVCFRTLHFIKHCLPLKCLAVLDRKKSADSSKLLSVVNNHRMPRSLGTQLK